MEQSFSDRLKQYRRDKNLTQQQLADMLGVSNKTVSRWESGGGYPDVPLLVPLAQALGVPEFEDVTADALTEFFATKTVTQWTQWGRDNGLPVQWIE